MRRVFCVVALLVCALVLAGCGTGGTNNGGVIEYKAGDRQGPVTLTGTSLTGTAIDSSADLGHVLVVNVWWSGCAPCRSEMPMISEVQKKMPNVRFLGMNIRDNSAADAISYEKSLGVTYPSIYASHEAGLLLQLPIQPPAPPATYIFDAEGKLAAFIPGEIPSELTLTEVIQDAEGSSTAAGRA
jgi:thiol-disulfide isomerase/thioredoxin